jgi:hypothetical protein
MKRSLRKQLAFFGLTCGVAAITLASQSIGAPWKFGMISDTQWPTDDGQCPNSVAVGIINQVNKEFINQGVKLVVAVGDVTDNGAVVALDTRATYAQELYNAGIAFYPLRGNHESSAAAAAEFQRVFHQTQSGINNNTPNDAFVYLDSANTHPVPKSGATFVTGVDFSSPSQSLLGLSYSFSYDNATFVLLDQFTPPDNSPNTIDAQQPWISSVLSNRTSGTHAFVFGHKGLITENHTDVLFGNDPSLDVAGTNAFIGSLYSNNVRYYFGGHDHMHNQAGVISPDGLSWVQEFILASDSYKFYTPANPSNDMKYDFPAFGHTRECQLDQDLYEVGYYIVTVDGPNVTIDYYAVPTGLHGADLTTTPALTGNWKKMKTIGYSLNGNPFAVAPGASLTSVQDNFKTINAGFLSGMNDSTVKDASGRSFYKLIDLSWTEANGYEAHRGFASHIVKVSGLGKPGAHGDTTDAYTFSMSYVPACVSSIDSNFALAVRNSSGKWQKAVDFNFGGTKNFINGPWNMMYGVGTYGVDTQKGIVWAVLNYNGGAFAAVNVSKWADGWVWGM